MTNLQSANYLGSNVLCSIWEVPGSLCRLGHRLTWLRFFVAFLSLFRHRPYHSSAVSRRLTTAAARVRDQVRSYGVCGGQSDTGESFLRVLRFPLSILISSTAPHSLLPSRAGTIGQLGADVPSGHSLTPPQESKKRAN
jgi:hypothetical protein